MEIASSRKRPASPSDEDSSASPIGGASKKSNSPGSNMDEVVLPPIVRFTPSGPVPEFKWNPPSTGSPAESMKLRDLLVHNAFIDKSAALYNLLKSYYNHKKNDFFPVSLHIVYPRRFAKTTLLNFIEAVFSPVSKDYPIDLIKTKIAALEHGKDLLNFGSHPVLYLNIAEVADVDELNDHIAEQFEQAGLDAVAVERIVAYSKSPRRRMKYGVKLLNEKFEADTGVATTTILMIDEHDKPFRENENDMKEDIKREREKLLTALIEVYAIGKGISTGISLILLCGLTRMVGSGLSELNDLVDISHQSRFHGLCGISAMEFIKCADGQLDELAKKRYDGLSFEKVLVTKFAREWDGFSFGLDIYSGQGNLDPNSPEGALFSPLDVWEIVLTLLENRQEPSSRWIATMASEFQFTTFAEKYSATEAGCFELRENLWGGWVDKDVITERMERKNYLELAEKDHVKKVLFELGLLSVKKIDGSKIFLGSPNWSVTVKAMKLLVQKAMHGPTLHELAKRYMDQSTGFASIVSKAAKDYTAMYFQTGPLDAREFGFHDFLFKELLFRFPDESNYKLYKEMYPGKAEKSYMALALLYEGTETILYMIDVKFQSIFQRAAEHISKAHGTNFEAGVKQFQTCTWHAYSSVDKKQKIIVSGVWHPCTIVAEGYELDARFKFL